MTNLEKAKEVIEKSYSKILDGYLLNAYSRDLVLELLNTPDDEYKGELK